MDGVRLPDPAFWSGRRVLLTGHSGFKGAWLARWLHLLGARTTGLSLADSPPPPRLWDSLAGTVSDEISADMAEPGWTDAVATQRPSVVLHLAAQALVPVGYQEPLRTFASNVMGTARLLDLVARLDDVEATLLITTDKVYDPRQQPPHRESDFLGGHDPYAASKAAAELVAASWPTGGERRATARAGNVIGGGDGSAARLLPDVVRAWDDRSPVSLRMPGAVRPWQHVLQPLHGYLVYAEMLAEGAVDLPRALNFGPDRSQTVTVGQVVDHAADTWRALGRALPDPYVVAEKQPPMVETGHLEIDSTLAEQTLGWRNVLDWRTAVEWTLQWYVRNGSEPAAGLIDEQIHEYERLVRDHD